MATGPDWGGFGQIRDPPRLHKADPNNFWAGVEI